jgi:predicted Zn-dependent protease
MVKSYDKVLRTLRPMEAQVAANPPLAYAYGASLVKMGEFSRGAEFLKNLEKVSPDVAGIHSALGEALAGQADYAGAVDEFHAAVKLDPSDTAAQYHLALALIALKQKEEAQTILLELVQKRPQDADVCYQLGKLQLGSGDVKAAIANLETAARIRPGSDYIHFELASAYRQDKRIEDADREMKLYDAVRNRHPGTNESVKPD